MVDEKKETNEKITNLLENCIDSVVGVSKVKETNNSIFYNDGVKKLGIGSGVVVSEDGYIITNEHVSGGKNEKCYVTLDDGKNFTANIVWSDSGLDLSIIKINAKGLKSARFGDSNDIKIGETIYAIGNPIGFEFQKTVTSGIISATNRTIKFEENEKTIFMNNLIQTDASINPGNSGGPLINLDGDVVGINSVKITSADGIGFAIPINIVKPIIEKLKNDGKFEEPIIGIFAYDKNVIPYLNNSIKFENGIYIANILDNSPAKNIGLKEGDIIARVDGKIINKMIDLREYVYSKNPGDMITIAILRDKKQFEIKLELAKK